MKDSLMPSFAVALLLLTHIEIGICLRCYQCDNVRNASDCQYVVTCPTAESCFTDTTGAGDNTRYTLGCRTKQICRQPTSAPQSPLIGRAVAQNLECTQCCGVDLCNRHVCASGVHGLHSNQCADDPKFNCGQISELFNVCNDKDHAKLVCRKFCDLCDIIDGYWLEWSSWSTCSQTCGDGVLTRTRMCNRTEGGLICTGDSTESQHCFNIACPVDGGWTSWSSWSGCSLTCGVGFQRRDRHCSNPYPGPDGLFCDGDSRDDKVCWLTSCTDGFWAAWSNWSSCSASCQGGISMRSRQCNTISLGHSCVGKDEEYTVCNTQLCDDGIWTLWSDWGSCSASCQGGISKRTRRCNTTSSGSFGHSCVGNDEENKVCNTQLCAGSLINGGWTMWSSWSTCSAYCMSERTRTCSNPAPSTYGKNCLGTSKENKDCNQEYCSHPVRLVNGIDPYEGRLEVFHNGQWGTVCDDHFNNSAAAVVCRMLNYDGISRAYPSATYGQGSLPIVLDDVSCSGSEESIFDCQHQSWGSNSCSHSEDVSVSCHTSIHVQLVNGTMNTNGRVEVSRGDNVRGTVCDSGFGRNDAKVVCRMLALPTNVTIMYGAGYYGYGSGPSFVTDLSCSSSESNFANCGHFAMKNSNCDHTRSIGIACVKNLYLRLVNGTNQHNGRVEASVDGSDWGPICDSSFSSRDASVICHTLDYPTNISIPYFSTHFGQGTAQHMLSTPSCSGSEKYLGDCNFGVVSTTCAHTYDVGVDCSRNINFRLVNGTNPHNGRVEVSLGGGNWGPICDSQFDVRDATVICRILGYPTDTVIPYGGAYFGQGTQPYLLPGLNCNGNERNIADCTMYGNWYCGEHRASGVWCGSNTQDINVRLVNGTNQHDGRVEVSVDGGSNWGPVCDSSFHTLEAKVVCRTLGYPTNVTIPYSSARFGPGTTKTVLNNIGCSGSENSLADCNFAAVSQACSRTYDVGVACKTNINVRLVNGTNRHNGRVEVSLDGGNWGPICDSSFDVHDATVICRMLGYPTHTVIPYGGAYFGQGTQPYLLGGLYCNGKERNIEDCTMYGNWQGGENHASGVRCGSNNQDINVRLVNGTNQHNGRVEVSVDGGSNWGPVCDTSFNTRESKVVCRTLGYPTNVTIPYSSARFGPGTTQHVLNYLGCSGSENSLADCNFAAVSQACSRTYDVGVACKSNINFRLVNGTNPHNGRVEVSLDGGNWGPVCDIYFDVHDATVICRMLGYPTLAVNSYVGAYFGQGALPYLLGGLNCNGNERNIAECYMYGNWQCGENRASGVWCG